MLLARPGSGTTSAIPFVNSNFHPDFATASEDMSRAWAALGYPEVDGVITVDVNALASILAWVGPVDAGGSGDRDGRDPDPERSWSMPTGSSTAWRAGLERHARNDQLATALEKHLLNR